ncbi:hypothetical protein [Flavobacterium sp.]|uniref:hypothetical protein n=1 Tax=Flavobacterium sp. TaxID=239 RepID=UPI001216AD87|nr:hypothetical protein [Flavobacterium sp.]RZJ73631.1 MAG: hypothetical protein EOO49_02135 [Flavobacterium sp.]
MSLLFPLASLAQSWTSDAEVDYMKNIYPAQLNSFSQPTLDGYTIKDLKTFDYDGCTFKYQALIDNQKKLTKAILIAGFSKHKQKPGYSGIVFNNESKSYNTLSGKAIFSMSYSRI